MVEYKRFIYLDFNSTTPVDPEVYREMEPFLSKHFGNPSSPHYEGIIAKNAIEKARSQVADLLECSPEEIVFTSGGSESNNFAIKGVFFALKEKGNHIITTSIEHPSVLNPLRFLEKLGAKVTYIAVDSYGRVDPKDIEKAITSKTILISVMHANNEVGTIEPIEEISRIARNYGVLFHTDAAQSVGKIKTKVDELGVDLMSIASHKIYGPKGVGALYIRKGTPIEPIIHGASQEGGKRAGTENVPFIVGFGKACEIAKKYIDSEYIVHLRDYFFDLLKKTFSDKVLLNGDPINRLPNTVNVSFLGERGSDILSKLTDVAASEGSACHSGSTKISPVLEAMGIPFDIAIGAVRFSLGRTTTFEELEIVVERLKEILL